jgi:MerR family transcriptional regulator, copper efflux regulator
MMTIGKLADRAGCNTASVRYYEDIKLLRKADRREGGHRTYGNEDVQRLTFIRRCRDFGFSIPQIRELIEVSGGAPCSEALGITRTRLNDVRTKISELQLLEKSLARFADRCAQTCCGGAARDCSLFEDLAS